MLEQFKVDVPNELLADLKMRLDSTRLVGDFDNSYWGYGTNANYLAELLAYWRDGYAWRHHERLINEFSQFRTAIAGVPIHFIHLKGKGPKPMPLILNHGWPWTFWDFQKIIGPLSDPAAFGGSPDDAFDIVVPSLPGFGFSTQLTVPGINFVRTADMWVTLMQDVLGYGRFGVQGGDFGASVSAQMGHKYADRVIGVHLHSMINLHMFSGKPVSALTYSPREQDWAERTGRFYEHENGYMQVQATRPQSLAYAMNDSPAGLCAWLLEKRRSWSDCAGDVERVFSKDDLLTSVMLYWVTESFGSAARYYYEARHQHWQPSHDRMPVVEAPAAMAIFANDSVMRPRLWAEQYYNLQRFTVFPAGGHFAPMEQPETLIEDLRGFFRTLRR